MDVATPLAGQLVAILGPFMPDLLKLAQGAAADVTAEGVELARSLWARLGPALDARPAAQEAATDVAAQPDDEDVRGALRVQLRKLLADDAELAADLKRLIEADEAAAANTMTVSGDRAVGVQGAVTGSTIVTGDSNRVRS